MQLALTEKALESHEALQQVFEDMVAYAEAMEVHDTDSFRLASSLWRKARDGEKQIEQRRKEAIDPYRKQIALINDKARELRQPLERVEKLIEGKNVAYQQKLVAQKQEEERRLREAAEIFDVKELYIEPLSSTMRTEEATTYTVTKKRFRVKDVSQVPAQYLTVNESAVEQALKLGVNEIAGLEIFTEEITKMRSR